MMTDKEKIEMLLDACRASQQYLESLKSPIQNVPRFTLALQRIDRAIARATGGYPKS